MKLLFILFIVCYLPSSFADTIYQWRDQWGQLQYSKTPVPGSMISDLTELPVVKEMTDAQKQVAMFRKLQEMRKTDFLRQNQRNSEKNLQQQRLNLQHYCAQLNNMLMDVQLRNANNLFFFDGLHFLHSYRAFAENDFRKEIRKHCR